MATAAQTGPHQSGTASWSIRARASASPIPPGNTGARLDIDDLHRVRPADMDPAHRKRRWRWRKLRDHHLALNKTGDRVLHRERGRSPPRRRWTEHRHPVVQRLSDPQWLEVDLGSSQTICQVTLNWEPPTPPRSKIQTSRRHELDTIYSTTSGTGGTQTLSVTGTGPLHPHVRHGPGHPVRVSLWEFGVYGAGAELAARGTAGTTNSLNKTGDRVLDGATRRSPASAAVDGITGTRWSSRLLRPQCSKSRSLGYVRRASARSPELGKRPTPTRVPDPDLPPMARTGPPSSPPPPGRRHPRPCPSPGTGRYIRMYGKPPRHPVRLLALEDGGVRQHTARQAEAAGI